MPDIDYGEILEALNDKVDLSGSWSAPTSQYVDLTLGSSGDSYTAPADGYYAIDKQAGINGAFLDIDNTTSHHIRITTQATDASNWQRVFVPARKGDIVQVSYNSTGATNHFRFIYAQKTN